MGTHIHFRTNKSRTCFFLCLSWVTILSCKNIEYKTPPPFRVIGYFSGPTHYVDSFDVQKLTHLIYCFGTLKGNRLNIHTAADSATIQKMVGLKSKNPSLKVLLSLGGWGGCKPCSDVFHTAIGREEFAISVKELSAFFKTDGIDLDWEYPAIPGPPGHPFRAEDRENFTLLLKELRDVNGPDFEISFAAGGFTTFIQSSIDWTSVVRYTDFINVMTYDLVHGYSRISGHHTPLYSTPQQTESTDHAVNMLINAGVPREQIVIGAVMYGRFFQMEEGSQVALYDSCHFMHAFSHKHATDSLSAENGFVMYWDSVAQAPYALNETRRILATYDDARSMALKTNYAKDHQLGGIMFWQLCDDDPVSGLLDVIHRSK